MTKNKHGLSRNIPPHIKLAVRQRCGFGCVICGSAIYHYEHFFPEFEFARKHAAEGITLLCPGHHEEKRKGFLTNEAISDYNSSPFSKANQGAFYEFRSAFCPEILIGQKVFSGGTTVISIEGKVILGFEAPEVAGAPPRLSFSFSDRNSVEVFSVIKNEIVCKDAAYDIESTGHTWTVRSAKGKIDLKIRFDLPTRITIEKLNFRRNHWGLAVDGSKFDLSFDGSPVVSMTGWVKVVAPCLYELKEDECSISSVGGSLTGGIAPSPLGSIPNSEGSGFSVEWPVWFLFDTATKEPAVIVEETHSKLGLYLRNHDVNELAEGSQEPRSVSQEQCLLLAEYSRQRLGVSSVLINHEIEANPNAYSIYNFTSAFGAAWNSKRNTLCFCGSDLRFKHCHGSNSPDL